jgi:hypothetical protein
LRTADAAAIDDVVITQIENALMRLSEAITGSYLAYNERAAAEWEALA